MNMELPDFNELPIVYQARISDIQQELKDGEITQKGYDKRLNKIAQEYHSSINDSHKQQQQQQQQLPSSQRNYPLDTSNKAGHIDSTTYLKQTGSDSPPHTPISPGFGVHFQPDAAVQPRDKPKDSHSTKDFYDARKSTVAGFRKPGINFDALLDDFGQSGDSSDTNSHYGQMENGSNNNNYRKQTANGRFHYNNNNNFISSQASANGSIGGGGLQKNGSSEPKSTQDNRAAQMSYFGSDGEEEELSSGRAYDVLNNLKDPYGSQPAARGGQQELYSDDSSEDGILDDLTPDEFNPDIVRQNASFMRSHNRSGSGIPDHIIDNAIGTSESNQYTGRDSLDDEVDEDVAAQQPLPQTISSPSPATNTSPSTLGKEMAGLNLQPPTESQERTTNNGGLHVTTATSTMITPDTPTVGQFGAANFGITDSEFGQQTMRGGSSPKSKNADFLPTVSEAQEPMFGADKDYSLSLAAHEFGKRDTQPSTHSSGNTDNGATITLEELERESSANRNMSPPSTGPEDATIPLHRGGNSSSPGGSHHRAALPEMWTGGYYRESQDPGHHEQTQQNTNQNDNDEDEFQTNAALIASGMDAGFEHYDNGQGKDVPDDGNDKHSFGSARHNSYKDDGLEAAKLEYSDYMYAMASTAEETTSNIPAIATPAYEATDLGVFGQANSNVNPRRPTMRGGPADRRPETAGMGRGSYYAAEPDTLDIPETFDLALPVAANQEAVGAEAGPGALVYPRDASWAACSDQLKNIMDSHSNIASVLRHRARVTPNGIAYTCLDGKGKTTGSWTWMGLHSRAEQVVQLIRQRRIGGHGERVGLVYRKHEVLDFVGSLFGCFYAGVCAVPIVAGDSYAELAHVLNSTEAALVLTTERNIAALNRDVAQRNVGPGWPADVAWIRTDGLGVNTSSAMGAAGLRIDETRNEDIAYIEFSKSPNGELKGVQLTHGAVMRQCAVWMMSTGMLGIGKKYRHRVELESSDAALEMANDYALGLADSPGADEDGSENGEPNSATTAPVEVDAADIGSVPTTPQSTTNRSWIGSRSSHHKWGGSGFLGKLRNVGSLPKIRRGSHSRSRDNVGVGPSASNQSRAASGSVSSAQGRPPAIKQPSRDRALSNASARLTLGASPAIVPSAPAQGALSEAGDVVVFCIEPRQHFGLVFGVLGGCFGGHHSVYASSSLCDTPGAYINVLTRYRATVAVGDYHGLQTVLSAAADDPGQIVDYSRKVTPNLVRLRLCLIDTLFIDPAFHTSFDRSVLHAFGCPYQSIVEAEGHPVVTPVCTLAEHGSALLAMRDCLPSYAPPNTNARAEDASGGGLMPVYEFLLDREAFRANQVAVLPDERGEAEVDRIGTVRYQSFGFPVLNGAIAVVDPETRELCAADAIGELWLDSEAVGNGFWGLPKLSKSIFSARFNYNDGIASVSSSMYLRTGLMGAIIRGRVLVFGFYEDRIRTLTVDQNVGRESERPGWDVPPNLGFHYAGDINSTIRRYLPQISECTAFEMYANDTHFPVIAAEVRQNSGLYATVAQEIYGVLRNRHSLHAYAVALCPPNSLPRAFQYGKRAVNAQLCRHQFESGRVNCLFVKISTDRLFLNLPPPAAALAEDEDADIAEADPSVALYGRWLQQTSLEDGMPSIDEPSGTNLSSFNSITEILIWRASATPERPAFGQFDSRGRALKPLTFHKLLVRVSAVAQLLSERRRVSAGDHVLIAMSPGTSFVTAIHACLAIGAVPIAISPPDLERMAEDLPPVLATVREFKVALLLVDPASEDSLRGPALEAALQVPALRALLGSSHMPPMLSISRASKTPKQMLRRDHLRTRDPALVMLFAGPQPSTPHYVTYSHHAVLRFCAQQKADFQMPPSQPIIASVRAYNGYGLLHCSIMGVYIGCSTLMLPPIEFFSSPAVWFDMVQRYKVKDAFTTLPMLQHAMNMMGPQAGRFRFNLSGVRNLIVATEERVDPVVYANVCSFLSQFRLDPMVINPLYGTLMNPCISTRAYLGVAPLTLRLDVHALRRARVVALAPPDTNELDAADNENEVLVLQDSGKVSGCTMVAIVDPATRRALPAGCIGEIWVASASNATCKQAPMPNAYHSLTQRPPMSAVADATGYLDDPNEAQTEFVRTGDLGFLYLQVNDHGPGGDPSGADDVPAEPYLFMAGRLSETFNVDGYMYFYSDVERAVEEATDIMASKGCIVLQTTMQAITTSSAAAAGQDPSAVAQAAGSATSVVETSQLRLVAVVALRGSPSDSFLPNAACLIFNNVLDRHQVLLDEIVFVPRDSLPRSRISERRRRTVRGLYESGKLDAYVSCLISNSATLPSGAANPNRRLSLLGPPPAMSVSSMGGGGGGGGLA